MGRRARLFDRRLGSARHLHQHFQSFDDRALTHQAAADGAEALFLVDDSSVTRGDRKMD